jgi:hypothetical protein
MKTARQTLDSPILSKLLCLAAVGIAFFAASALPVSAQDAASPKPGLNLPDPRPGEFKGTIHEDARDSKAVFPVARGAPENAPNVW